MSLEPDAPSALPSGLPWLGLGLSSNLSARGVPQPYRLLDAHPRAFDYVEYTAPLRLEDARAQAPLFETLWRRRREVPVLLHPVHLNLYGPELEATGSLRALDEHARAVDSAWVSNDLAWWHAAGHFLPGFLYLSPPFDEDGLADCERHVRHVQSALGVPLLVENPAVVTRRGDLHPLDFVTRLSRRTGAGLVLDLGHLLSHQLSAGLALDAGLDELAFEAVFEIHVAGGLVVRRGGRSFYVDDHPQPVREELFRLLECVLPRCTSLRALTYEGDGHPEAIAARDLARLRSLLDSAGLSPSNAPEGTRTLPAEAPPATHTVSPAPPPPAAWRSRPWEIFEESFGARPSDADPDGALFELDLRLAVLAGEVDRVFPLTRLLLAPGRDGLRAFGRSPELRSAFEPPGREPARAFAAYARRLLREREDDEEASAVLAFETWVVERLSRPPEPPPPPGRVGLGAGVALDAFPIDLRELLHAARSLRRHRRMRAEAGSDAEDVGADGVLRQSARRAPRRRWALAMRSDGGRVDLREPTPALARVLDAARRGPPAQGFAEEHGLDAREVERALASGWIRVGKSRRQRSPG